MAETKLQKLNRLFGTLTQHQVIKIDYEKDFTSYSNNLNAINEIHQFYANYNVTIPTVDSRWTARSDGWLKINSNGFFPYVLTGLNGSAQSISFYSSAKDDQCAYGIINVFDPTTQTALARVYCHRKLFDNNDNLIPYGSRPDAGSSSDDYKSIAAYDCLIDYKNNTIKRYRGNPSQISNLNRSTSGSIWTNIGGIVNAWISTLSYSTDSEDPTSIIGAQYVTSTCGDSSVINTLDGWTQNGYDLDSQSLTFTPTASGFLNYHTNDDLDIFKFFAPYNTLQNIPNPIYNVGYYPCGFFVEYDTVMAKCVAYSIRYLGDRMVSASYDSSNPVKVERTNIYIEQNDYIIGTSGQPNPRIVFNGSYYSGACSYSYSQAVTGVGTYTVNAYIPEDDTYLETRLSKTFNVLPVPLTEVTINVSQDNIIYGQTPSPRVTVSPSGTPYTLSYSPTFNEIPNVGTYTVTATVQEGDGHGAATNSTTFNVVKANHPHATDFTIRMNDYSVGDTAPTPIYDSSKLNGSTITIMYRGTGTTSYNESSIAPTQAGTYECVGYISATQNYNGFTVTDPFEVFDGIVNPYDVVDGECDLIIKSSTYVGNVPEGNIRTFLSYGQNREPLPISRNFIDGKKLSIQGNVNEVRNLNIDTLIEFHCPYNIDRYIIQDNRIICFTNSVDDMENIDEKLNNTPFSLCKVKDTDITAITNVMPDNTCVRRTPKIDRQPIWNWDEMSTVQDAQLYDIFNNSTPLRGIKAYDASNPNNGGWYWDNDKNSFVCQPNSSYYYEILGPYEYDCYIHRVTLSSTNSDDDIIGFTIAYSKDENDIEHSIGVYACGGGLAMKVRDSNGGYVNKSCAGVCVAVDYEQYGGSVIDNSTNGTKVLDGIEYVSGANHGWSNQISNGITLLISRVNERIRIWVSYNDDTAWSDGKQPDINLNPPTFDIDLSTYTDPSINYFVNKKCRYAYGAYSQAYSFYKGVVISSVDLSKLTYREVVTGYTILGNYSDSFIIDRTSSANTSADYPAIHKNGTIDEDGYGQRRLLLETPYHTIANYYYPNSKIYYEVVKGDNT